MCQLSFSCLVLLHFIDTLKLSLRTCLSYLDIAEPHTTIEIKEDGCDVTDDSGKEWREELVWQVILLCWIVFLSLATWATYQRDDDEEDSAIDSGVRKSSSEFLDTSDVVPVQTIQRQKDRDSWLNCFSIQENNRILFEGSSSKDDYPFIYTYRFVFLFFATGVHVFQVSIFWSSMALVNVINYHNNNIFGMINTHFSNGMGLNFVWAGFLGFKGRFNELYKTGKIDFFKAYSNRVLRTIPTVLGCYLLILAFPRSLLSGPIWKSSFNKIRNNCLKNWWIELTFTQNMIHPRDMGLMPSWIIPSDIQFFTVSFFFIFMYHRRPKLTRLLTVCTIFAGVVIQAIYIGIWHLESPFLTFAIYDLKKSMIDHVGLHIDTVNYTSSYFIGFLCAIMIHEKCLFSRMSHHYFTRHRMLFIIATFGLNVVTYLWGYSFKFREVSSLEQFMYGSLARTMMAVATAMLLYWNCTYDDGFRSLLNNRIFTFLGQFNYSIYMAHFLFMYLDVFSTKEPLRFDFWSIMTRTCYVLFFGIIFGYFIHILFEAPFIRLSRHLFSRSLRRSSQEPVVIRTDSPMEDSPVKDISSEEAKEDSNDISKSRSPIKYPTPPLRDCRRKID